MPSVTLTVTVRAVVEGSSVVFSKAMDSIASAYASAVAAPDSVMVSPFVPERVQLIKPPASVPLLPEEPPTSNRSPV